MGIPKFYRWLSERYPLLNQPLTAVEACPEFDNLYLDMNGIIHNCTHGNDPTMKLTEEEMILRIFMYLDKLIQIIKPQNLVFMAIDGVAPRAKMNQQRSRRFKTGMERERAKAEEAAKAIKEGRKPDDSDSFDSNCITPGTAFMARLGAHLRFFVRKKLAEDVVWQKPKVIFSGHDVPGEGEHKIMEYIRLQQRSGEMAPNSRHCMYGLDADLIMLSLVTHEPHFCLLREVVSYTGRNRGQPTREALDNPSAEHFVLFQIGLLREYLEMEFTALKLPFALDVERVIDDFVLFCMLIGNDFLPALPTLDISEGALNNLTNIYKELLPGMGGYLTHAGALDRSRLELLLGRLAALELQTLQERAEDAEFFERKRGRRGGPPGNGIPTPAARPPPMNGGVVDVPLVGLEEEAEAEAGPAPAAPAGPTMMSAEARLLVQGEGGLELWKERYYVDKLEVKTAAGRRGVVEEYVKGLHWVLEYYYRGVASWNWYYPYHYAPMASDLQHLDDVHVVFSQGKPFRPFEQLLSVLPATSSPHLPQPFRWLMSEPSSPILDFYPTEFEVDMEGKRADWEGIAKICFVDEERLLKAATSVRPELLTAEERKRNDPGPILVFSCTKNPSNETDFCTSTLPHKFADVLRCNSRCRKLQPPPPLPAGQPGFQPRLSAGTTTGLASPAGFPTLKTMAVTGQLKVVPVNLFGSASKKESYVVQLKDLRSALGQPPPARSVAGSVVSERCYVNWPYLKEATVVAVSDVKEKVTASGPIPHSPEAAKEWACSSSALGNTLLTKHGIDAGKCDLLLHVKDCIGYIRHVDDTIEKKFATTETVYPLQAVLRRHPAHAALPAGQDPGVPSVNLEEGQQVVFLGRTHYGALGTLMPDPGMGLAKDGQRVPAMKAGQRWRVQLRLPASVPVDMGVVARRALKAHSVKYMMSGEIARKLGISSRAMGRITGNLWISEEDKRFDLGLAVKDARNNMCVPGYAAPMEHGSGWMYSKALQDAMAQYKAAHPWVLQMLESQQEAGSYRAEEVLPGLTPEERKQKIEAVQKWLKSLPLAKRRLVKVDSRVAPDEAVRVLVANLPPALPATTVVDMENVPQVLLLPPVQPGDVQSALVGQDIDLGDRVVCLKPAAGPPFGSCGTVIAIYEDSAEVLMDAPFTGGSDLQGRLGGCRNGAHLSLHHLLSISYPAAINLPHGALPRVVKSSQEPARQPAAARQQPAAAEGGVPAASKPEGRTAPQPAAGAPSVSKAEEAASLALLLQRANISAQQPGLAPSHRPTPQPAATAPRPTPQPAATAPRPTPPIPTPSGPPAASPRPSLPPGLTGPSPTEGPTSSPPVPKFLLQRAQQRQAAAAAGGGATARLGAPPDAPDGKPAPAKGPTPKMPDGSRGFGRGRGRPLAPIAATTIAPGAAPPAQSPATTPPPSPGAAAGMALLARLQAGPTPEKPKAAVPPSIPPTSPPAGGGNPGLFLLNQLQRGNAAAGPAAKPQPASPAPRVVPAASPPVSPFTNGPPPGIPMVGDAGRVAGRQLLASLTSVASLEQQLLSGGAAPSDNGRPQSTTEEESAALMKLLKGAVKPSGSLPLPGAPPPPAAAKPYNPLQQLLQRPPGGAPPPGMTPPQPAGAPAAAAAPPNPGLMLLSALQKKA